MVAHLDAVTCLSVDSPGLYLLSGSKYCRGHLSMNSADKNIVYSHTQLGAAAAIRRNLHMYSPTQLIISYNIILKYRSYFQILKD